MAKNCNPLPEVIKKVLEDLFYQLNKFDLKKEVIWVVLEELYLIHSIVRVTEKRGKNQDIKNSKTNREK
jgi:hypothetical protein